MTFVWGMSNSHHTYMMWSVQFFTLLLASRGLTWVFFDQFLTQFFVRFCIQSDWVIRSALYLTFLANPGWLKNYFQPSSIQLYLLILHSGFRVPIYSIMQSSYTSTYCCDFNNYVFFLITFFYYFHVGSSWHGVSKQESNRVKHIKMDAWLTDVSSRWMNII